MKEERIMTYYITAESFGADIPDNWEQIANELNEVIDAMGIAEDKNAVNELWDRFWSNAWWKD